MKQLIVKIFTLYLFAAFVLIIPVPGAQGSARSSDIVVRSSDIVVRSPEIKCSIENSFAAVKVSFEMENTGSSDGETDFPIEIPDDAFLTNLTIAYNGTNFYGVVKEDEEAQQEYEEAVESGKSAIKIEKNSVTSFSMTLNLLEKKPIQISYTYHQFLVKELGGFTKSIEPALLLPSDTSTDISVRFEVSSPSMITSAMIESPDGWDISYHGTMSFDTSGTVTSSDIADEIKLNYETETTDTDGLMQFHRGQEVTYFVHTFAPGMDRLGNKPLEKDIVFIVDKSGSMSGDKMTQTKEAFKLIINELSSEYDRFNIISFSSGFDVWKTELQAPGNETIEAAVSYINGLEASGGTNIYESLEAGLDTFDNDTSRMKIIVFLTDGDPTTGEIQAPNAICSSIYEDNKVSKVSMFSLGVGDDMKFEFLEKLSFMNYARAYRIDDEIDISEQIAHFYDTISTPLIYRLNLVYENADSVYQRYSPYLFEGQEHCVLGQIIDTQEPVEFRGTGITMNGTTSFRGDFTTRTDEKPYIAQLWAFMHIRWCEEKMLMEGDEDAYRDEIIHTAIQFQIVTEYTTMIVVAEEDPEEKDQEKKDEDTGQVLPGDDDTDDVGGSGQFNNDLDDGGSNKFADDDDEAPAPEDGNSEKRSPVSITVLFTALIIVVAILKFRRHRK